MTTTTTAEAEAIIDQALKLSATERELIARRLLDSVEVPPNTYRRLLDSVEVPPNTYESADALRAELQRRIEAVESGAMKTYTHEEAMAKIRQDREGRPS